MSTPHPYLDRRQHDLDLLAAGEETGWWDEHGTPAPFPEDFWLADGTINPDWRPASTHTGREDHTLEPTDPPF